MRRLDLGPGPGRKQDREPGVLALGISCGLHGAALAGFVLFQEVAPPEPYAVIAVELVQAADVVGTPGGDVAEPSHSSPVTQQGSVAITENTADPERLADMGDQDERPAASEAPNSSDSPPVEPVVEPTRDSTHGPMPEKNLSLYDIVPLTPSDPSPIAENSSAPVDPIETTQPIPPAPRRKPLDLDRSTEPKLAESGIEEQLTAIKDVPSRPIDQKSADEVAQSDAEPTSARMRQVATLDLRKDDADAALSATGRRSRLFDNIGDSPGTLPKYSGGGLSNPAPRYPYLARRRGQEGRVVLLVHVTAGGDAAAVRLRLSSGHRLLDEAAVEAIKKWRFVPATRAGTPVAGSVDVPVSFILTDR